MAELDVQRNYRRALAMFLVVVIAISIEILTEVVYLFLISGAQNAVTEFAWGHVPRARLSAFIWLSRAVGPILIGSLLVRSIATMILFYFAALSLRGRGIKQYFGPALTAWSLLIPFYSLYRPWAGLGEVRNTLAQARQEHRLPAAGITGANAATVLLAVTFVLYGLGGGAVGVFQKISASSGNLTGAARFTFLLNTLIDSFAVLATLQLIVLAVTVWYWVGMFRLIKTSLSLPPIIADLPQNSPPPLPGSA
jgi:hypothetical protein